MSHRNSTLFFVFGAGALAVIVAVFLAQGPAPKTGVRSEPPPSPVVQLQVESVAATPTVEAPAESQPTPLEKPPEQQPALPMAAAEQGKFGPWTLTSEGTLVRKKLITLEFKDGRREERWATLTATPTVAPMEIQSAAKMHERRMMNAGKNSSPDKK